MMNLLPYASPLENTFLASSMGSSDMSSIVTDEAEYDEAPKLLT